MAQKYSDGADLPFRVVYKTEGRSSQEVRFSDPTPAKQEVEKLVRRGNSVNFDVWSHERKQYITQERFN